MNAIVGSQTQFSKRVAQVHAVIMNLVQLQLYCQGDPTRGTGDLPLMVDASKAR